MDVNMKDEQNPRDKFKMQIRLMLQRICNCVMVGFAALLTVMWWCSFFGACYYGDPTGEVVIGLVMLSCFPLGTIIIGIVHLDKWLTTPSKKPLVFHACSGCEDYSLCQSGLGGECPELRALRKLLQM